MTTRSAASLGLLLLAFAAPACSTRVDLVQAIDDGDESFEQVVLRATDLERPGDRGHTALLRAAERGRDRIVRLLLARGAKVDARDEEGLTALHLAAGNAQATSVHLLLRAHADPNARGGALGRTPLHIAAQRGSVETTQLLLQAGADPNLADSWGETPLHYVAKTDWWRASIMTPLLVGAGADLGARDIRGFTPLHAAAARDMVPIVRHYHALGRPLDDISDDGRTALDLAIEAKKDRAGQLLASFGATAKRHASALPPLHDAARMNDARRVLVLLAFGVDPETSYRGKTAQDVALASDSREVAEILAKRDP